MALARPSRSVDLASLAVLKLSGIDVSIFIAHSTRSASVSAAADSGVITSEGCRLEQSQYSRHFTIVLPITLVMAGLCCLRRVVKYELSRILLC